MNSDALKMLISLLAFVMGILALYFGVNYFQQKNTSKTYLEEKAAINSEYEELLTDFEQLDAAYDSIKNENEILDSSLIAQFFYLEDTHKQISRLLRKARLNKNELESAKAMIAEFNNEKETLLQTLQNFNKENEKLTTENEVLTTTLNTVKKEKEVLKVKTAELDSVNKQLVFETDRLRPKAIYGELVRVRNVLAEGVKYKKRGKEKATKNYKRVEQIKLCYELEGNPVADKGQKEYLLRIISPESVALFEESRGSGLFVSSSGEQLQYTAKTYLNYENETKKFCLYWSQGLPFQRGLYVAEIYQNGYLLDKKTFELKSGL